MTDEKPERGRAGRIWIRILAWTAFASALAVVMTIAAVGMSVARTAAQLPSYAAMKASPTGRTVRVHAADGKLIETSGPAYGEWLEYERIPDVMLRAIVAIEDRRYMSHPGVDPKALARVAWLAFRNRGTSRRLQGASTITQQAARTVFLSQRYEFARKYREMVIAAAMEQRLDKQRILELYLNRVYMGGGAYGIDAAARTFFGHSAAELTMAEAAILAGLVKAPSDYAPTADGDAAYGRARVVLGIMRETGAATAAEAAAASSAMPAFARPSVPGNDGTRYFLDWIRPQIEALSQGARGTVDVWTTFDSRLQGLAMDAVAAQMPKGAQGALVSMTYTGAVLAMVGGSDYRTSSYNRATQAVRQPGSSFKLFVYMAALEAGRTPGSTMVDAPVVIGDWSPRNNDGSYAGAVTLESAFARSLNTVAARIGRDVGIPAVTNMARRLGITTPINPDPAMVLGTSEARVIDMTGAYATVAAGGIAVTPYGIERITSGRRMLYRRLSAPLAVVAPHVAADMEAVMTNAVATGTGSAAAIGRPVAGKTGTTSSNKDGWFLGFSSGLATGIWYGRDDAAQVAGLQGGRAPARAFAAYMRPAVADLPPMAPVRVKVPGWGEETSRSIGGDATAPTVTIVPTQRAPAPEERPDDDDPRYAPYVPAASSDGRSRAFGVDQSTGSRSASEEGR